MKPIDQFKLLDDMEFALFCLNKTMRDIADHSIDTSLAQIINRMRTDVKFLRDSIEELQNELIHDRDVKMHLLNKAVN